MDLLLRRHCLRESAPGRPASFAYTNGGANRDEPNPNTVASEKPEDQPESDSADDSNGGQPESCATMANQRGPRSPKLHLRCELRVRLILHV